MFVLCANKSQLTVQQRELAVSGSVNANAVQFRFSPDWDGLTRTAIFRAGAECCTAELDESGQCVIPREVLETPWARLMAGVCGKRGEEVTLPTVWADLGTILEGAKPGEASRPPAQTPGGTGDHRALSGREAADQHPIGAITGLAGRLEKTITTDSVLSVNEILKIMEVQ